VAYTDGAPASGVTVTASGPSALSTSTLPDGSFALLDLIAGSYTLTPSHPARYFYPFTASVALAGSDAAGIEFEAHDGMVHAVAPAEYSITINDGGSLTTVYVYAGTVFSGAAPSIEQVVVGYDIEAEYYSSTSLAVHVDTDQP
jgi:hypothetical protein